MNYFKILLFLEKGNRLVFDFPKNEQKSCLDNLGEAKDDIDRGYKQYLCQNQFVSPRWKICLFNVVGAVVLPLVVFYFLFKRIGKNEDIHIDCLIERKGMPEVVPEIVRQNYHPSEDYREDTSLSLGDLRFVVKMAKTAPWHPYFVFKALMNVARYSDLIYRYRPQAMIQFGEFSFSSSVLTAYCHLHGVKHIDVMHGEKLFNIRDAYFHYDECYVWSEHYVRLLTALKAEPTQFRIAVPPSLKIDSSRYKKADCYADYKYYLANYSEERLQSIVSAMAFAEKEGKSVKYRPHPRYSNLEILRKYVPEEQIELPEEVTIMESVANLGCAVGSFTTVLVQAHFSEKNVMMDDVAQKKEYDKLRSLDYILSDDKYDRISKHQI